MLASLAVGAATITALAASGGKTVYATAWMPKQCERVVMAPSSFGPKVCPQVSTGRGIAAVELAGDRILWLGYAGGNTREWSLFTATKTSPTPHRLRFVSRDVDRPSPIVLGPSDGTLLAYAVGREVVAMRSDGSRAFTWRAAANVTALAEAGKRVAVAQVDGVVSVLSGGKVSSTVSFPYGPSAIGLSGRSVVAQLGNSLVFSTPKARHVYALPRRAALEDVQGDVAVYVASGKAHVVRLSRGRQTGAGKAVHAQLDGSRLVLATDGRIAAKHI